MRSPLYSRSFSFLWFSITIILNSGQNTNTSIKKNSPNTNIEYIHNQTAYWIPDIQTGNRILAQKCPNNSFGKILETTSFKSEYSSVHGYSEICINLNLIFSISKQNFDKMSWNLLFLKNFLIFLEKFPGTRFPGSWLN